MSKPLPTPELLRKLLRCESETGKLFWREREIGLFYSPKGRAEQNQVAKRWNTKFSGKETFNTKHDCGYFRGTIFNRKYFAHRVIWAMNRDDWPLFTIDHINGVRDDNVMSNLRDVTHKENIRNSALTSTNTSGFCGVSWELRDKKWRTTIVVDGKRIHLGKFADIREAAKARKDADVRYGFHRNHGQKRDWVNYAE